MATARKTFNENESETRNMHIKYLTEINCSPKIQNDFTDQILSKYIIFQVTSSCSVQITRTVRNVSDDSIAITLC